KKFATFLVAVLAVGVPGQAMASGVVTLFATSGPPIVSSPCLLRQLARGVRFPRRVLWVNPVHTLFRVCWSRALGWRIRLKSQVKARSTLSSRIDCRLGGFASASKSQPFIPSCLERGARRSASPSSLSPVELEPLKQRLERGLPAQQASPRANPPKQG